MTKISQSVNITKTHNTSIVVEIPRMGNRWEVQHVLWFARELEKAVAAGMSTHTEVVIDKTMAARHIVVEDQPVRDDICRDCPQHHYEHAGSDHPFISEEQ